MAFHRWLFLRIPILFLEGTLELKDATLEREHITHPTAMQPSVHSSGDAPSASLGLADTKVCQSQA